MLLIIGDSLSAEPGQPVIWQAVPGKRYATPGGVLAGLLAAYDGTPIWVSAKKGRSFHSLWVGTPLLPAQREFDTVLVFLGTNDAAQGNPHESDMGRLRDYYPGATIVAIGPPELPASMAGGAARVYEALERVFSRTIDARPLSKGLPRDAKGIHFTRRGAQEFGQALYQAVTGEAPGTVPGEPETLIYEDLVSSLFAQKVREIAAQLNDEFGCHIDPNWLMGVMRYESNFNPHIVNRSGATGLIQFLADVKKITGFTRRELAQQSAEEQLSSVLSYYRYWIKKVGCPKDFEETYVIVHGPGQKGHPERYTDQRRGAVAGAKAAYAHGFTREGRTSPVHAPPETELGGMLLASLVLSGIGLFAWLYGRRK